MFLKIICMLHSRGPKQQIPSAATALPPQPFVFGIPFKSFCCSSKIPEILTTDLELYTTPINLEGPPLGRTPLVLLRDHQTFIDGQEQALNKDYLPPGYPDDPQAQLAAVGHALVTQA
ncbi:hypothetical protein VP01_677g4 [Puccinia sorghi]|uniref:Uncharacterized protein n=1 Tax=Puccinia sorghi TaxID=27349 RepID=A0A0L6UEP7_9BASI|nr:hypothetical protein VP01_677g4 [Puccinia sorghi]